MNGAARWRDLIGIDDREASPHKIESFGLIASLIASFAYSNMFVHKHARARSRLAPLGGLVVHTHARARWAGWDLARSRTCLVKRVGT